MTLYRSHSSEKELRQLMDRIEIDKQSIDLLLLFFHCREEINFE